MVGELLKNRREELGLDLREISKTLKIRYDYLKAIEDGIFKNLPQDVYVKGYIREYAEILKIDPEIVINAYLQQVSPPQVENKEVHEEETAQRKKIKIRYVLIPLLLASFAITAIFILFPSSQRGKDISQSPLKTKKEIFPVPAETRKEVTVPLPAETEKETSPSVELKKSKPLLPGEPKKEAITKTGKTLHVLEISAADITWLSITIDETNPKEILMNPGESVRLQAKNGFSVIIGNAGGVKLVFDGKEISKLGEKGQVIRINLPKAEIYKDQD